MGRAVRHPEIVWAQRSDKLFLTVELPDAVDPSVELQPDGRFVFRAAAADSAPYEASLELYGSVSVEESKVNVGSRHTLCIIHKQEQGWWKRLLKSEGKMPPYVKVDWNKWIDEDEEADSKGHDTFSLARKGASSSSDHHFNTEADGEDEEGMLYLPELEKEA
ncbi:uncharacterized protein At3g03773 [Selaginella moellendorffii]|uniref:uncharacterized protein At3g03773 n=1 Tax=Selaginella moellendorffii TaxID=88036 RepID=UPI000D1C4866|nr:uncharacterized protein At3g03773 [Selaginella moellendorffii]|eukprot:XP_002988870.2 uncharacterized protein At3g03773 [Selaginella moellendorffii]